MYLEVVERNSVRSCERSTETWQLIAQPLRSHPPFETGFINEVKQRIDFEANSVSTLKLCLNESRAGTCERI